MWQRQEVQEVLPGPRVSSAVATGSAVTRAPQPGAISSFSDPFSLATLTYYHGGGWVIADINAYDATPRAIAKDANAVVVSVEYRHAPENKFPAQHEDAVAAYKWALENAGQFDGDPKRVAVMGESAGGNLAVNVAIAARDQNLPKPVAQVLV